MVGWRICSTHFLPGLNCSLLREENITVPTPRMTVTSPCLPPDLTENITLGEDHHVRLKGAGNFHGCKRALLALLNKGKASRPCVDGLCHDTFSVPGGVEYRHLEFYGLSEFWYSMHDLLMVGGDYKHAEFERAAKVSAWGGGNDG